MTTLRAAMKNLAIAVLFSVVPLVLPAQATAPSSALRSAVWAADSAAAALEQLAGSDDGGRLLDVVRLSGQAETWFSIAGKKIPADASKVRETMAGVAKNLAPRLMRTLVENEGSLGADRVQLLTAATILREMTKAAVQRHGR